MTPRFLTSAICKDGLSIYQKGEDCGIKSVFRGKIRNSALGLRSMWLLDIPVMLYVGLGVQGRSLSGDRKLGVVSMQVVLKGERLVDISPGKRQL